MNALDILLRSEIPQPQEKQFKQLRLSELAGEDVIFTLRQLSFHRVAEIRALEEAREEMDVHILLAGLADPDPKSKELLQKYGAVTPAELLKKLLLPGEITDLAREVEKLSGYRMTTLEEFKKN